MKVLNWGILATGNIAHQFCSDLQITPNNKVVAVCSRTLSNAQTFANEFNIQQAYDDYQVMLADPEVDVIYIATPHPFHYQNTLDALRAGKHVVCEKPIGMSYEQVQHCVLEAQKNNCFLLEALWMYFFPAVQQAKTWIEQGKVGAVNYLTANFDFCPPQDPNHRLYNLELGGGALMDIGLYPLFFSTLMLGQGQFQHGFALKHQTGADTVNQISCTHQDGSISNLSASFLVNKSNEAFVFGELGYIKLENQFFCSKQVTLHLYNGQTSTLTFEHNGNGYGYEIEAVNSAISAGNIECDEYSHEKMLSNHSLLTDVMAELQVKY